MKLKTKENIADSIVSLDAALQLIRTLEELHSDIIPATDCPMELHRLYRTYRMTQALLNTIVEDVVSTLALLNTAREET
jgi:hypothetical protein